MTAVGGSVVCTLCGHVHTSFLECQTVVLNWGLEGTGLPDQVISVCSGCGLPDGLRSLPYRIDTETLGYRSI